MGGLNRPQIHLSHQTSIGVVGMMLSKLTRVFLRCRFWRVWRGVWRGVWRSRRRKARKVRGKCAIAGSFSRSGWRIAWSNEGGGTACVAAALAAAVVITGHFARLCFELLNAVVVVQYISSLMAWILWREGILCLQVWKCHWRSFLNFLREG